MLMPEGHVKIGCGMRGDGHTQLGWLIADGHILAQSLTCLLLQPLCAAALRNAAPSLAFADSFNLWSPPST